MNAKLIVVYSLLLGANGAWAYTGTLTLDRGSMINGKPLTQITKAIAQDLAHDETSYFQGFISGGLIHLDHGTVSGSPTNPGTQVTPNNSGSSALASLPGWFVLDSGTSSSNPSCATDGAGFLYVGYQVATSAVTDSTYGNKTGVASIGGSNYIEFMQMDSDGQGNCPTSVGDYWDQTTRDATETNHVVINSSTGVANGSTGAVLALSFNDVCVLARWNDGTSNKRAEAYHATVTGAGTSMNPYACTFTQVNITSL